MEITATAAIVTGGASGLGAATSVALGRAGAAVTIIDLNEDAGMALAVSIGGGARFIRADVADPAGIADAVALAAEDAPLRIAVNCAGIGIGERTIDRTPKAADLERFTKVLTVNLIGTYNVASQAAAAMSLTEPLSDGERGVIINTASVAAFDGQIGQTAYSASKGGVVGMTLPMARDLSSVGIRVMTIAPGIIETNLLGQLDDAMIEALEANIPFPKRLGQPEDFANLVLSVIDNGYLNGETIRMDAALRMPPR
jgi:NAD(P)-dependent dehydrogenase (short-subunit alcohol dehydrogenase family)